MNTLIVLIISLVFLATLLLLRKRKQMVNIIIKTLVVVLIILITANNFFNDSAMDLINGGWKNERYFNDSDHFQIMLRSLRSMIYIILPLGVFGKGRFYKNAAVFFCLPVAVLCAFFYRQTMEYYLTPSVQILAYVVPSAIRHIIFTAELSICIFLPLAIILLEGYRPRFRIKEYAILLAVLPVIFIIQLPPYAPAAFWGYVGTDLPDIQIQWILLTIVFTVGTIAVFRFKNKQTRLEVCWLLTLALFLNYNNTFLLGFSVRRLPFQLCNMASYFMLIAMITRSPRFFNFVFLANVTGTIIAMLIPEAAETVVTSFHAVRYMYQHSLVMIAPCVAMGLRIFPRLSLRAMINAALGFSVYWVFCLIVGAFINANPQIFIDDVNLFYLFDMEIIGYLAPWSSPAFTPYVFFGMTFRPAIQVLILIVFYGMTCLLFLVVSSLYKFNDDHLVLRKKLIEIIEKKTRRKIPLPVEFID